MWLATGADQGGQQRAQGGPSLGEERSPQKGGERAYRGRLGKDRSLHDSCQTIARAKYASPPEGSLVCPRRTAAHTVTRRRTGCSVRESETPRLPPARRPPAAVQTLNALIADCAPKKKTRRRAHLATTSSNSVRTLLPRVLTTALWVAAISRSARSRSRIAVFDLYVIGIRSRVSHRVCEAARRSAGCARPTLPTVL
jgi:hypothetical protein